MRHLILSSAVIASCSLFIACETLDTISGVNSALQSSEGLSAESMTSGLKEMLQTATTSAVDQASSAGGFSNNPDVKIPLPEELTSVSNTLKSVGLGDVVSSFEGKLNEAAEAAAGEASPVFSKAISEMTFDDVTSIINGGNTAATDYLQARTSNQLQESFTPIIESKLKDVGALDAYNSLKSAYSTVSPNSTELPDVGKYVGDETLSGIFKLMGQEETKIRQNPAEQTSQLIQQLFSLGSDAAK